MEPAVDFTFNLQCKDAFGAMITYDKKAVTVGHAKLTFGALASVMNQTWSGLLQPAYKGDRHYFVLDPRTSRFGVQTSSIDEDDGTYDAATWSFPPFSDTHLQKNKTLSVNPVEMSWISRDEGIMGSLRNGWGLGAAVQTINPDSWLHPGVYPYNFPTSMGFYPGNHRDSPDANQPILLIIGCGVSQSMLVGLACSRRTMPLRCITTTTPVMFSGISGGPPAGAMPYTQPQFYADPDGVVRLGMGGWTDSRTKFVGDKPTYPTIHTFDPNYTALTGSPMRVAHALGTDNELHKTDIYGNYPPNRPPRRHLCSRPMPGR